MARLMDIFGGRRRMMDAMTAKIEELAASNEELRDVIRFSLNSDEMRQVIMRIGNQPVIMTVPEYSIGSSDKHDPNVATAVRLIKSAISGLPIIVEEKISMPGQAEDWEILDEHPLLDLFNAPNPFHDRSEIIRHICQGYMIKGSAHCLIIAGRESIPTQLWPLLLGRTEYDFNNQGIPLRFIYDKGGANQRFYAIEEILHVRNYDANAPFDGISPLEAIKEQMLSNFHATTFNKSFFKNGASLDVLFKDTGNLLGGNKEKQDKFLESWDAKHKGIKKSFKRGILPQGFEPVFSPQTIKDMMFAEGIKLNREQMFSDLGIPPSEGGVYEYANYANALIQKRTFWENTIIPIVTTIQLAIERQIIRVYFKEEDIRLRFDLSQVGALQDDRLTKAQADATLVNSGIITINEARQERHLPPLDWGDERRAAAANPIDNPPVNNPPNNGNPQNMPRAGKFRAPRNINDLKHLSDGRDYYGLWYAFDQKTRKLEDAYEAEIRGYFADQRRRIIAKLKKITNDGATMAMLYPELLKFDDPAKPVNPDDLFDLPTETEMLKETVAPVQRKVTRSTGQAALNELNIDAVFDMKNPRVLNFLDKLWNRSSKINETTFGEIKDLLRTAYDEGWALGRLTKEINSVYGEYGTTRAQMIARTEMGGIVNGATTEAYVQANVDKEWLATMDDRVRDSHAEANGMVVAADGKFLVGGDLLEYPGDPTGSPENTINCRCTIVPAQ